MLCVLHTAEEIQFRDTVMNVTYEADSSALVPCTASGKPEPEISWRFKNKKITVGQ